MDEKTALKIEMGVNRVLAHQVLFAHRHKDKTPHMHVEMIEAVHSSHPQVELMAFRGGGKSTILEEAAIVGALYQEFKNCLIVGATIDLAAERLQAIKHEFETNDQILELFGNMIGEVWTEETLVLSNGTRFVSRGRGQKMRGTKFRDQRPDFILIDDIEDDEDSKDVRNATKKWMMTTLMPATDVKTARYRVAATPVDPEALAEDLRKDDDWLTLVFPAKFKNADDAWEATWADRFPLKKLESIENGFRQKGMLREFNMEYMCLAAHDSDRFFRESMIKVEPQVRTWQAVYGMFDPARTVGAKSATTGFASWSWVGPRLVVWDSWARKLMPDQIVEEMFKFAEQGPAWVGVEEDGLNEFLLQPIRQEMIRRGQAIPLKAVRAPKGKRDFILGLQPFFRAREVVFATQQDDMRTQLLGFPNGAIDAPNALAYALRLRPGAPVYDGFGQKHVNDALFSAHGSPMWLCLNASNQMLTGVLAQLVDGCIRVHGDYVKEGEPSQWLESLIQDAQADAGRHVRLTMPPEQFDRYSTTGLVPAVRRLPAEPRRGATYDKGRAVIRSLLSRESRGRPMLEISTDATWTLNGFSAGYARAMTKGGILADYAEEGPYRLLCEGLESFAGVLATGAADDSRDELSYAVSTGGRRYVTAMPRR